jgi:Tol biopolymer transport system component
VPHIRWLSALLALGMTAVCGAATAATASSATVHLQRVSVSAQGAEANRNAYVGSLSGDGGRIAFRSSASNLVPGDTNGTDDVFVTTRATGAIVRASTTADGAQSHGAVGDLSLSRSGDVVAFTSYADDLVPGDTNGKSDVFVKTLSTGVIVRASTAPDGAQANAPSIQPSLSADGTKVAFLSDADNFVAAPLEGVGGIFVKDLRTGAVNLVSASATGVPADQAGFAPSISADGSAVLFESRSDNLVARDTNSTGDLFLKQVRSGKISRVNVSATGAQASADSRCGVLSSDGTRMAFLTSAPLVAKDTNHRPDVYLRDVRTGTTALVSMAKRATHGTGGATCPAISGDGTRVSFLSTANDLVAGDHHKARADLFVKNTRTGAIALIGKSAAGYASIEYPNYALDFDGRVAAFSSHSSLMPGDSGKHTDVFVLVR